MSLVGIVIYILILIVSVVVHEYSHGWVSYKLGDPTAYQEGRLSLNPLKHIDMITTLALPILLIITGSPVVFGAARPVPINTNLLRGGARSMALVALAGPLSNLVMAMIVGFIIKTATLSFGLELALRFFVTMNISFFVFNMIPFPPLDGSRILLLFLPQKGKELFYRIEGYGLAVFFVFLFLSYNFLSSYIYQATNFIYKWIT